MIVSKWWYVFGAGLSLAGFAATQNLPDTWDVKAIFWIGQFFGITMWVVTEINAVMYQAYVTGMPVPWWPRGKGKELTEPKPVEPDVLHPIPDLNEQPVYSQIISPPRFDKERNFAITLLRMHEHTEGSADLTEKRWVASGKFVRDEFKLMLSNWEDYGLIRRRSAARNSPYIVEDWRKLRLVAEGNALPIRD